jgi:flagellar hook-associated protein 2
VSETAGSVGRMIIDMGALGLDFATTQEARDAVVLYGQSGAGRMMVTSTTNSITGLIKGLKIDLVGTSDTPVNISVTADDDSATSAVQSFVDDWNSVIDKIKEVTKFNTDTNTAGPLLGNPTVMRIEDAISRLVSYTMPGASPTMNRLSRIGVSFLETGRIAFDETKMKGALGARRQDVEDLFTTDTTGFGAYASSVVDTLTDEYQGVIKRTNDQYDSQIELFQEQSESMAARLAKVQERLYNEFYGMEEALANLQTQKTAIDNWPNYLSYSSSSKKS